MQKLLGAADLTYRVAILEATEAGFRVGEIRGVQWTDIRGDEVTISFDASSVRHARSA